MKRRIEEVQKSESGVVGEQGLSGPPVIGSSNSSFHRVLTSHSQIPGKYIYHIERGK